MSDIKHIPLPYFIINHDLTILESSHHALDLFGHSDNLLTFIDKESQEKAKRILIAKEKKSTELVMSTLESSFALFQLKINWVNEKGHIVCIEQDGRIQQLIDAVEKHRKRLSETNFELLDKKEQLEESLAKIMDLSAPSITLTDQIVLVPLFGDLEKELIDKNNLKILQKIKHSRIDKILFDFHGVGEITAEGINELRQLTTSIELMGASSYIIGVKPAHAKVIHQTSIETGTDYLRNLNEAIRSFVI
ncbi:STAS domain-containing protein [Metabacillus sp. HB246100]